MGRLSSDVAAKINGRAWDGLREKFLEMCEIIADTSPDAVGELTTVYVKFTIDSTEDSSVYAVAWLKNSRKWIVGLALPESFEDPIFVDPPKRYVGLTKYFYVEPDDPIPTLLTQWTADAYKNIVAESSKDQ